MFIIHNTSAIDALKAMAAETFDCVVTSPPYWGCRNYGVEGQLGNEDHPEDYVLALVSVLAEVKRVLRTDGTLWLNLGDAHYSYRTGHNGGMCAQSVHQGNARGKPDKIAGCKRRALKHATFKDKDLFGLPWMVANALRLDGWYLRMDIIWFKPNPMPEKRSIDRPFRAHEYIFLLSKSRKYQYSGYVPSVWTIPVKPQKGHPASFPVALASRCIELSTVAGQRVLDPFCGSGTTGVAALAHGCHFEGIELNSEYAQMARNRLSTPVPPIQAATALQTTGDKI